MIIEIDLDILRKTRILLWQADDIAGRDYKDFSKEFYECANKIQDVIDGKNNPTEAES